MGLPRIITGDRKTATYSRDNIFKSAKVITLPAVQGEANFCQLLKRCISVDAEACVVLPDL